MANLRTRARHRRDELDAILDRIVFARSLEDRIAAIDDVRRFFVRVEQAGGEVWPYAEQVEGRYPPDKYGDEERMVIRQMIAEIAASYLCRLSRGAVQRRYKYAK